MQYFHIFTDSNMISSCSGSWKVWALVQYTAVGNISCVQGCSPNWSYQFSYEKLSA